MVSVTVPSHYHGVVSTSVFVVGSRPVIGRGLWNEMSKELVITRLTK
jgi:hypothetical protein